MRHDCWHCQTLAVVVGDSGCHGSGQVGIWLQALALDHTPVQIPGDHVARRRRFVEGGESVATHVADCGERRRGRLFSIGRSETLYGRLLSL